jgi:hypothetical protein
MAGRLHAWTMTVRITEVRFYRAHIHAIRSSSTYVRRNCRSMWDMPLSPCGGELMLGLVQTQINAELLSLLSVGQTKLNIAGWYQSALPDKSRVTAAVVISNVCCKSCGRSVSCTVRQRASGWFSATVQRLIFYFMVAEHIRRSKILCDYTREYVLKATYANGSGKDVHGLRLEPQRRRGGDSLIQHQVRASDAESANHGSLAGSWQW